MILWEGRRGKIWRRRRSERGKTRTWLRGNPGSPGMEKLVSRAMFWTSFCASLFEVC